MAYESLNAEKALIWRIIHRDNLPWVLDNGLHCGNSQAKSQDWVEIGNAELIGKRAARPVPTALGGQLGDYIPFYFTPFSPMLYNILTAQGDVHPRQNEEIVILVSSLHRLSEQGFPFVFTDRHAYLSSAQFFNDLTDLDKIPWPLLQKRDFRRNPENTEPFERYQAEALVYQHLPVHALLGIVCFTEDWESQIEQALRERNLDLPVHTRREWYFS